MVLPPHEQETLDRLACDNPLGWKPWKRDPSGVAILRTDLPIPSMPGWVRVCTVALTPEGRCHFPNFRVRIEDAPR